MTFAPRTRFLPGLALFALLTVSCSAEDDAVDSGGVLVGTAPVPAVHLFEQHSHALVLWMRAGIHDRVVVHVDGHSDLDWLPDEAVARFSGAEPGELEALEHHPYAMDGETYRSIGIWNFLYPAHRLGVVREVVWVVPDGSLPDESGARSLVRGLISEKMHGVSVEEATGFRWNGSSLEGRAAGVPLKIVELENLEAPEEPVLLDLDLDYLTTRSAESQEVVPSPRLTPSELVTGLRSAGVRTDRVTISYSTVAGFFPPAARWVGPALRDALAGESTDDAMVVERMRAHRAVEAGKWDEAIEILEGIAGELPGDAPSRYLLSLALSGAGRSEQGSAARDEAVALDPVLADADLYEADALWLSGRWSTAEQGYRSYLERVPDSDRRAYAKRRIASCLMRTGRDAEAADLLREVLAIAPRHADSHLDLALLLRERGNLQGAIDHLREARSILPERATYAMALGTTLAMAGRSREALDELRFAVGSRPSWERAHANLAAVAYQNGLRDDALLHGRTALALGGREPVTRRVASALGLAAARD